MQQKANRNSGVELLRIIGIFFVVISHNVPVYFFGGVALDGYINLNNYVTNIRDFFFLIFNHFGNIGNTMFIICSAWFLVDSSKVKIKKIMNIEFDVWIISFFNFILFLIFGIIEFSTKSLVASLFPTLFCSCWFVTCYLMFYAIHPIINKIIFSLQKKQLLVFVLILTIIYSGIQVIKPGSLWYSSIIGFVVIYFQVAYLKLYMGNLRKSIKLNVIIMIASFSLLLLLLLITNFIAQKFHIDGFVQHWNQFMNPLIILFGIAIFNVFNSLKFYNKHINKVASTTLLIYIIHENILFRTWIKPKIFEWAYNTFGQNMMLVFCVISSFATLAISAVFALTYERIVKCIKEKTIDKSIVLINKYSNIILNKLLSIN